MKVQLITNGEMHFSSTPSGQFEESLMFRAYGIRAQYPNGVVDSSAEELVRRIQELKISCEALRVTLKLPNPESEGNDLMTVAISSGVLKHLQLLLYPGYLEKNLKLSFIADFNQETIDISNFQPVIKTVDGANADFMCHMKYEQSNVKISPGLMKWIESHRQNPILPVTTRSVAADRWTNVNLFVEIDRNDYLPMTNILPEILSSNRRIYNDKDSCDVTIITRDGARVPCHKIFLTSSSPVFQAMFRNAFQESRKNEVVIKDMDKDGLTAFLEYLYFRGLEKPKKEPQIALQMFNAAEKYGIETLKETLTIFFLMKLGNWQNLNVALVLFLYVRNLEGMENLKDKIVEIIVSRRDDLKQTILYTDKRFTREIILELLSLTLGKRRIEEEELPPSKRARK